MAEKSRLKSFLFYLLKFAIAGGIIWYLLRNPREIAASFRSFDLRFLLPAAVTYGSHILFCAWRWWHLARILGVKLNRFEALSLTMQGIFFSLVIPGGAIGGDVVKMGFISKRSATGSKMEGAFSVLIDRIIGMIALFSLALILVGPATPQLLRIRIPGFDLNRDFLLLLEFGLAAICVAGLAASCVIFFHRQVRCFPPMNRLMEWGDRITHGMVSRMTAATDRYAAAWRQLTRLTVGSVFFVHLMTVVPFFFLLRAMNVEYSFFGVIVAVTIGNIVGLIPLFPGGIGGRDVVTVTLFAASGIPAADAKSAMLIYTAILLFFNLVGGLFFMLDPGRALEAQTKDEKEILDHGR